MLEPHVQRMKDEYEALLEKGEKLAAFTETEQCDGLPKEDQMLLFSQLGAMTSYLAILKLRLHRAGVDMPEEEV